MKWNKKDDTFTLTRHELADMVEVCTAWMFHPKKERPVAYAEFHRKRLCRAHKLLMEYMKDL